MVRVVDVCPSYQSATARFSVGGKLVALFPFVATVIIAVGKSSFSSHGKLFVPFNVNVLMKPTLVQPHFYNNIEKKIH